MERRLAAILIADTVGYSRLLHADEAKTLAALKARRKSILEPLVDKHRGRLVKLMGDGFLVEFTSAVSAVQCAVELQAAMEAANRDLPADQRLTLRVGLDLGEVVIGPDDLYGHGVNVAARLEALAEPGAINVSQAILDQVRGKVPFAFEDLGKQSLKNIPEPVRVYRVARQDAPTEVAAGRRTPPPEPSPAKPSIVVLPFTNMSGDPGQEYFSDGITEDIIMDLSQVSSIFVVARNTAFTYKGMAVKVTEVAQQLNVGYILQGSVRKAATRIRINVQLIDGATGDHLWTERYDRAFGDIFALQDDISRHVVTALKLNLLPEELRSIGGRATMSAEAYEWYLRARSSLFEGFGDTRLLSEARKMFLRAAEIDPGYARAYAGIAECDAFLWMSGATDISYEEILTNSNTALAFVPNLAEAHASKGLAHFLSGHAEEAVTAFERAIELDPELFEAHEWYGEVCRNTGQFAKAADLFERAAELRSADYISLMLLSDCYGSLGLQEQGAATARRAFVRIEAQLNTRPDDAYAICAGAAALVSLGDSQRAEDWARRALAINPENYIVHYNAACTYAVIGRFKAALERLEHIFSHTPRVRFWLLGIVRHDFQLDSLRNLAAFQDFVARLEADVSAHSSEETSPR